MRKNFFYLVKGSILCCIILYLVFQMNRIFVPKFFYDIPWATNATFTGFYKMPKNSVEVIFMGSSHGAAAFIPQELYNNYSITSYNLSSEQQNLLLSYYWLREALKYQTPKVVILDTFMLHPYEPEEALNGAESCVRKALDYMRWGREKVQAINDVCKYDKTQDRWSFYFTNIRFHARWTTLVEDDFTMKDLSVHYELKGYEPFLSSWETDPGFESFTEDLSVEGQDMVPLMEEYLEKIVDLCEVKGIDLILVKTPTAEQNLEKHNATLQFARDHDIAFIDFNEQYYCRDLRFDFQNDMTFNDGQHMNLNGARKITDYLGRVLVSQYQLGNHEQPEWEATKTYYDEIKDMLLIPKETDIEKYLTLINRDRYTVFVAVREEASANLDQTITDKMKALGFHFDLAGKYGYSYYAVKAPDKIIERNSIDLISEEGTLRNGRMAFSITSAGNSSGNTSSIIIDGEEHSRNMRGLNFVVYDNITKKVIDSVCFDTSDADWNVVR